MGAADAKSRRRQLVVAMVIGRQALEHKEAARTRSTTGCRGNEADWRKGRQIGQLTRAPRQRRQDGGGDGQGNGISIYQRGAGAVS